MSDNPFATKLLGAIPYPTAEQPPAPENPLKKYYDQLYQLNMGSAMLHQPVPGGPPGKLGGPPPTGLPPQMPGIMPPSPAAGGAPGGAPGMPPELPGMTPGAGPAPMPARPAPFGSMPLPAFPTGGAPPRGSLLATGGGSPNPLAAAGIGGEAEAGGAVPSASLAGAGGGVTQAEMTPEGKLRVRRRHHEISSLRGARELPLGSEDRVSTRIPYSKKVLAEMDPHEGNDLHSDLPALEDSKDAYVKNAMELQSSPDLPVKGMRKPENIMRTTHDHLVDNLMAMHGQMVKQFGQHMVDRASRWYDGVQRIAHREAARYGYLPRQAAGAIAALSPQKDWYQNKSLFDRTAHILNTKKDTEMTPEMRNWIAGYIDQTEQKLKKREEKKRAGQPEEAGEGEDEEHVTPEAIEAMRDQLGSMRGRKFREINDPDTRALWLRAYDEAHHSRDYRVVTPEGDEGDYARNDDGSRRKVAWGSFDEIKKAMRALEGSGERAEISRLLGGNHKVRNFYNNIIAPEHGFDVTNDTHAVAAAHWRPLSGNDYLVKLALGMTGAADARTGMKGTYGLYTNAYREAARRLGLTPRQMQSIAWEGVRGMFLPAQKRDKEFWNRNFDIWNEYRNGNASLEATREAVLRHARGEGGLVAPAWWRPGVERGAQTQ